MSGAIINESSRVILVGEWATEVLYDVMYSGTENVDEFNAEFDIESGYIMADPKESFYQGIEFMRVIRRKSDDRLFGYPYWKPVAKYDECDEAEPNGEEHGFEPEWNGDYTEYTFGPHYVWLPVAPFVITGYAIATEPRA